MPKIHHVIDIYPEPREKEPVYVNEPELIDYTAFEGSDETEDNIRVYIPLDLNQDAILRRLDAVIAQYGEASEYNEFYYELAVRKLVSQVEIYNQIWTISQGQLGVKCCDKAKSLITAFIEKLEDIPDACVECFPFELIDDLKETYL